MSLHFRQAQCCLCHKSNHSVFCKTIDRLHGIPGEFQYDRCESCGIIFQNPQVVPEDVHALYPPEYAPWDTPPNLAPSPKWKRTLRDALTITGLPPFAREKLDQPSTLLDVGCGNGKFMARIAADHPNCRVEGVDFSPKAAAAVQQAGFPVHVGTLPEVAPQLGQYDAISMWWYLEHLHDPETILRLCATLLKKDGFLCCGVPNEHSLGRLLFRGRWYHLDPPRHLWIFSPRSLTQLMDRAGLRVVHVKHDYSPWGILGSLQYFISGKPVPGASWVENRWLKLAFRPPAIVQGLLRVGDTFSIYAQPK